MAGLTKFVVDDKALAEMLRQTSVGEFLNEVARTGVEYARSMAPVLTGDYQASLDVFALSVEDGAVTAHFGTDSPIWHFVEFGSANNAPHRVLSSAAQAVASRVELR